MTTTYTESPQERPTSGLFPPVERLEWTTTDMEVARSQLEAAYNGHQFRAMQGPEPFSFRFASAGDDRLKLQSGLFTGRLQGVIPWSRNYVMSWFRSGSVTIDYPQGQLASVGSRPFLTPTETSFAFLMTPHRHGIVDIDARFLEDIATERHAGPSQRIVFDYAAEPTTEAFATWRNTLGEVTPLIVGDKTPPLARLSAQSALVRAMLDLFPWRAVDVPDDVRTESTRQLRLALEFVHANAEQPLNTADIATAAGMHVRSLQHLMSRHIGCTPSTYLREVRLDRVRQDLLSADPTTTQVAQVAHNWGFGNLGRFSSAYVARFGEYPRDTLRF